ncbi:hypothetical protein AJ80_01714 [Polytolypa hystricis UAMH7299]|uniref:Uncharacterized protein n=1 Tax=Polytolypa hystricis (strain UAMH7299) TaxID=1447883 RepID=A0A2B7YZ27_POLH7|nr:hypothetical protein AJ80_01714 [Polytolypa hystricis UAMH7299]
MAPNNDNVTSPTKDQRTGFQEHTLSSIRRLPAGVINVTIGKNQMPFVNVQAQTGRGGNRHTYSHVNVVADRKVGADFMKKATE